MSSFDAGSALSPVNNRRKVQSRQSVVSSSDQDDETMSTASKTKFSLAKRHNAKEKRAMFASSVRQTASVMSAASRSSFGDSRSTQRHTSIFAITLDNDEMLPDYYDKAKY